MNSRALLLLAALGSSAILARADNFVTITPTGAASATVASRWAIGSNLSGLGYIDGNSGFAGATATNFFTINGGAVGLTGNPTGFISYEPTGSATPQGSVGNSLAPDSYSGLTYVAENLSLIGPLSFYSIHHRATGDYLALIQPSVPTVSDQKPMSVPGGPLTAGASGYFALSFASDNPGGWGAHLFYYFRTNGLGETVFGSLVPALLSGPTDRWNLGSGRGYTDLAYTSTNIGFGAGASQFYYLRLDPVTQTTFFGRLDPQTGVATDIQDLGGVYRTLTFTPTDVAYGANKFYTIGKSSQTISFGSFAGHTGCDAPFTFTYPTASSGLPVTIAVTGPATVSGNTVTLTGAAGNVSLTASQAGNASFIAAPNVVQFFSVSACVAPPAAQTITFGPFAAHTACDAPFTFTLPTASSGLPVTIAVTGPATVSGNTVTLTGTVGTVVLTASQPGNSNFLAAANAVQSFPVTACVGAPAPQTITFGSFGGHTACEAPFTFTYPAASSGLPVTIAATGPASVSGNTVTLTGAVGTVVLTASQAGNSNFLAAPNVVQTFPVTACGGSQAAQAIAFGPLPGRTACEVPFTFTYPTASSGLPVTITVTGPATVSGNTVTLSGALGTVVLTASQAGNSGFLAAPAVTQSFAVVACAGPLPPQTITFGALSDRTLCAGPFTVSATSSSGLPVTISVTSGPATVSGNTVTLTGAGIVTLQAAQTGNTSFAAAPPVSQTFAASKCDATIILGNLNAYHILPFNKASVATVPAGLPVIVTYNGSTSLPTIPGTYAVVATIDSPLYAGTSSGTFILSPDLRAAQTLTFGPVPIPNHVFGDAPFTLSPTASSGMPTVLVVTSGPATVSGNTVTLTGAGPVVLELSQPGDIRTYLFAALSQSFVVAKATAAVQLGNLNQAFDGAPKSVTATTTPAGLSTVVTYNGSSTSPSAPGTYAVHGAINDPNYQGAADATLTVSASRIVNFSVRSISGAGSDALMIGFVVSGDGEALLMRGVGPGLAAFGVPNTLPDPYLTVFGARGALAVNDDWQSPVSAQPDATYRASDGTLIASTAAAVGAFALPNASKDAALLITLNSGAYSASLGRPGDASGAAVAELYEAPGASGARLVNVSARTTLGGGRILIAGLVIAGNAPKTVLIRGVGPTLSAFGVSGVLADPAIAVYSGATVIASNDNWESGSTPPAQLASASAAAGAFALLAGSKDAALLVVLQPGAYTVQVSGPGDSTGVALVEIYGTN